MLISHYQVLSLLRCHPELLLKLTLELLEVELLLSGHLIRVEALELLILIVFTYFSLLFIAREVENEVLYHQS